MTKQITSLAPLKEKVRDLMEQRMPASTREVLLENLLDQAYLAAVIDLRNDDIEQMKTNMRAASEKNRPRTTGRVH